MPSIADHLLIVVITIAIPVYASYSWKAFRKELAHKKAFALRNAYIQTLVLEWSLVIALIFLWWYYGRTFTDLGFSFPLNFRTASSMVFTLLGCIFFIKQWIDVRNLKEEIPDSLKKQIEHVAELIPETKSERRLFFACALTAGFCEELLYRGFLLWYTASYLPWLAASIVAILIFGFAHAYQGKEGIVKTTLMSIVMVGLYLWSGSLAGPILLHAVIDLSSGFIGAEVKKKPDNGL